MRSEHFDVIVIGAGTAGCAVAGALTAAGRSVLLVDRDGAALEPRSAQPVPLTRLRREDFGRLEHFDGESAPWPLDVAEMTRWYDHAEETCAVRTGAADADPGVLAAMHRLRAAGLQPAPTAMGAAPAGAPRGCSVAHGAAQRIETDVKGREARAVIVERDGRTTRHTADAIILAAGAVGSAALLLRSWSDAHPSGLANASGVVGRNLVRRCFGLILALTKREPPRTVEPGFTVDDFYLRAPGWRFPGGHVRLIGSSYARTDTSPVWPGPHAARSMHSLDFLLASEGLPDAANRVVVARSGEVSVHFRPTNGTALRKLSAHVRHVLQATGSACVHAPLSMHTQAAAQLLAEGGSGTVRMGTDPAKSAVRPDGRAHDVENLWVVDASTLPSAGAVDPTLTRVAMGLRAADAILESLGASAMAVGAAEGRAA